MSQLNKTPNWKGDIISRYMKVMRNQSPKRDIYQPLHQRSRDPAVCSRWQLEWFQSLEVWMIRSVGLRILFHVQHIIAIFSFVARYICKTSGPEPYIDRGTPNSWFIMDNPILGYPYFRQLPVDLSSYLIRGAVLVHSLKEGSDIVYLHLTFKHPELWFK